MEWVIGFGLFVATLCVVEGILFLFRPKWDPDSITPEKRLERSATPTFREPTVDLVRRRRLSDIPGFHEILSKIPIMSQLDRLVIQANSRLPLGVFILLSLVLVALTYLMLMVLTHSNLLSLLIGLVAGTIPFLYLKLKKRQRMKKFERQFPDALDLMARSLRAGHAFSGGLQMVAQEFDDPMGPEFQRVMNEINYGSPVDQALKNLTHRIDVKDLTFFTVSVIVQRETGGNLAAILESIARLVRERFKLQGKIRALSAEGKLSAVILLGLPFLVALALSIVNPTYLRVLLNDPLGRILIVIALCMMCFGIIMTRKIIAIKV
jgi:tight adherence protein B